jgi:radical SAM family uncharacterized protein/radical SAM-linked protein
MEWRRRYLPVQVDDLILRAQKPSRYVGGEVNSVVKSLPDCRATWALCFPDTYEVGMSNVGFRVIYAALNQRPDVACERSFLPWPDLESLMRAERVPLWSLESRVPLSDFDIVGITMQFETCYPGVLALLDLAGIPLTSAERGQEHPLVLGGGPCAVNAEPMHAFFDALVVGEGEEVVHEITDAVKDWKDGGGSRRELLWRLSEIPGVYVPSYFDFRYAKDGTIDAIVPLKPGYEKIVRRIVPDLNLVPQPERPIVPFMQTIFDRLPLEIQRGCTRGCRFCQVGMLTRPTRQRDPNQVRELAEKGLANSGYEEVGFLSLSAGDYECLNPMLEDFFDRFAPERIAVSIPTLRTETMNARLTEQIKRVRKTGFTVAPEAATERLRQAINKGNSEKDLLHAVETVFASGWNLLKLYFMIGLPTETDDDVAAIVDVAKKSLALARRHSSSAQINVAVSTFVPKPFTPFQWEPMIPLAETQRKHALLRERLGKKFGAIRLSCHESDASEIEGALSLGDRRVATAVLSTFRQGARLDGWSEHFSLDRWQQSFKEVERQYGVGVDFFSHRERGEREVLPWDHIDVEVTKTYLWKERMKARSLAEVKDCVSAPCTACGACDYDVVDTRVYHADDYRKAPAPAAAPAEPETRTLVRVRFTKTGRSIALSHLETMTAVTRSIRRARLPIAYTQGFHPKPKMGFGPACPVGVASEAEYFDLELLGTPPVAEIASRLDQEMPAGMRVLGAEAVEPSAPSLSASLRAVRYRVAFPDTVPTSSLSEGIERFQAAGSMTVARSVPRQAKGRGRFAPARVKEIDLKSLLMQLSVSGEREVLFTVRAGADGSARPSEVLAAIFGDAGSPPQGVRILKEAVSFEVPERTRPAREEARLGAVSPEQFATGR